MDAAPPIQQAPLPPTLGCVTEPPAAGAAATTDAGLSAFELSLTDAILLDHRNALLLANKLSTAAAQGNAHALELLAAALAVHLRLHGQGVMDTLCPLLRQWLGKRGAGLAAAVRQQVEAVERDMLEMLTFRRERDWLALVRWAEITRKEFTEHVRFVEGDLLPSLVAHMHQEELVAACRSYLQHKQTAPLAPHTASIPSAAAADLGPGPASILGGSLLAAEHHLRSDLRPKPKAAPLPAEELGHSVSEQ